jgi:hypothetical protein
MRPRCPCAALKTNSAVPYRGVDGGPEKEFKIAEPLREVRGRLNSQRIRSLLRNRRIRTEKRSRVRRPTLPGLSPSPAVYLGVATDARTASAGQARYFAAALRRRKRRDCVGRQLWAAAAFRPPPVATQRCATPAAGAPLLLTSVARRRSGLGCGRSQRAITFEPRPLNAITL